MRAWPTTITGESLTRGFVDPSKIDSFFHCLGRCRLLTHVPHLRSLGQATRETELWRISNLLACRERTSWRTLVPTFSFRAILKMPSPAAPSSFIRASTEGVDRRRPSFVLSAVARASSAFAQELGTDKMRRLSAKRRVAGRPANSEVLCNMSELDQARFFRGPMVELANASFVRPGVSSARTR